MHYDIALFSISFSCLKGALCTTYQAPLFNNSCVSRVLMCFPTLKCVCDTLRCIRGAGTWCNRVCATPASRPKYDSTWDHAQPLPTSKLLLTHPHQPILEKEFFSRIEISVCRPTICAGKLMSTKRIRSDGHPRHNEVGKRASQDTLLPSSLELMTHTLQVVQWKCANTAC